MNPFWTNGIATLFQADARQIPLPDQSVHCVVTSPPYYGLRVYRSSDAAMIGLEQTVQDWLDSMLQVMAEVWRVLRDDGVCWVNLGDSYGGSGKDQNTPGRKQSTNKGSLTGGLPANQNHYLETGRTWSGPTGQLLGIPWRFALAMQDAGWILRSDCIWAKKSPMPESLSGTRWERCRVSNGGSQRSGQLESGKNGFTSMNKIPLAQWSDCPGCDRCQPNGGYVLRNGSWRCTSSHEHVLQFVKGMGYYSDGEAVKRPGVSGKSGTPSPYGAESGHTNGTGLSSLWNSPPNGANRRNVWNDIRPEPYGGEHYATFPPDLPRLCIQASTSEAGVCAACGAQWARVVEMTEEYRQLLSKETTWNSELGKPQKDTKRQPKGHPSQVPQKEITLSWRPTCGCEATKAPAVVLDPFAGTGTTLLAAMRLGRRSYGTDLSEDYLKQAIKRLSKQSLPMEM